MSRGPEERLNDIVGVRVAFDAILHNLFVIGEASKALPKELVTLEPDIPWADIAGMRDVLGHQYHRVVPSIIHATVRESLGPLEGAVGRLLSQLRNGAR
ncbi:MAG: DUF86 domain-containing protein [Actinomycetota bacterium]|nr:DUF86 domain-containing protein [Actinomycetota bacterium]